ncbi:MAG TPA: hypothetical protein VKR41_12100 [Puia sp.]|nr:hypothetical protein [Puia sp.]
MKYSQWIGIAAALLLIAACFMPWAYFPDLGKEFTGFFSEENRYGRPGKLLTCFSAAMIALFVIPKVWAKRTNIIVAGITVAFVIRCYILFTGCYGGICPGKRAGIYLLLLASALTAVATLLPNLPVKQEKPEG